MTGVIILQSFNQIVIPLGKKKGSESLHLNHENEIPLFFPHELAVE